MRCQHVFIVYRKVSPRRYRAYTKPSEETESCTRRASAHKQDRMLQQCRFDGEQVDFGAFTPFSFRL